MAWRCPAQLACRAYIKTGSTCSDTDFRPMHESEGPKAGMTIAVRHHPGEAWALITAWDEAIGPKPPSLGARKALHKSEYWSPTISKWEKIWKP
jgi:hypothetical protein